MLKLITTSLILFTILFSFATPALAVDKFSPTLGSFQSALGGDNYNKQTFDFQSLIGVMGGLYTMLAGCVDSNCPQSLKTGAVFSLGTAVADIYANPPASGIYYVADVASNFGIAKPAYAQSPGNGFRMLSPFLNAWRAVRNFSYILFAIVFVVFGLSIMFRSKVSPQAVITIQSALPRIIIALLLITFSYAIVGFMVDLVYVIFGALVWGLSAGGLYNATIAQNFFNEYANSSFATTMGFVTSHGAQGAFDILTGVTIAAPVVAVGSGILTIIAGALAIIFPAVAGALAVALLPLAIGLIITIIVFMIRVLFTLARSYLLLLIYLVFAPFFLMWAILSGQGIWQGWLRGVIANLLVFPLVGIIIFLVNVLIQQIDAAGGNVWGPPYLGNQSTIIKGMISLGAIMLLPQVTGIINQILSIRGLDIQLPGAQRQFQDFTGNVQQRLGRRDADHGGFFGPTRGGGGGGGATLPTPLAP